MKRCWLTNKQHWRSSGLFFDHPLHPITVHFPIALYLLGVGLTVGYLWRKHDDMEQFAYWCFSLSLVMAVLSALTGLIDQNQLTLDDPRRDAVDNHITMAIGFMIINGSIVYLRLRWSDVLTRYRWVYLGLLGLGTIAILLTAWLGGELVYTLGVGVK